MDKGASGHTGYYADLVDEAAAPWESLAQNQPFVDGNERTAFAATYTFLAINGARLAADADHVFEFISSIYEDGNFRFDTLVPWLSHSVKTSSAAAPTKK